MRIFTVTTIHIDLNADKWQVEPVSRSRCVGWFGDIESARRVILTNSADIYEQGYYNHAVIEELDEGLYPHPVSETWFCWRDEGYKQIEKPPHLIGPPATYVNFGIG